MPLLIEVYNSPEKKWISIATLGPNDQPGSLSDNDSDGGREIYMFKCASDGSHSVILHSKFGIDIEIDYSRQIDTLGLELVKELRPDDKPLEMTFRPKNNPESPRLVRFSHI